MSSLLQHHGGYHRTKGVELLLYLQHKEPYKWDDVYTNNVDGVGDYCPLGFHPVDSEPIELQWNDSLHIVPKLYRIYRKPKGMFGCWVIFRFNGVDQVPDLSVPIAVDKLPRDAKPLTNQEQIVYWQRS